MFVMALLQVIVTVPEALSYLIFITSCGVDNILTSDMRKLKFRRVK